MSVSSDVRRELVKRKVKGFFFVRQKRIPTILGQGLSIGIDSTSYVPMLYQNESGSENGKYITEVYKEVPTYDENNYEHTSSMDRNPNDRIYISDMFYK